jgi:hypothetical protein
MRRTLFTLTLLLPATLALAQSSAPVSATAQSTPAPEYPVVRVGMVSFLQYDAELENRGNYNAFDVTRAYLNVNGQLAQNVRFRFTPDVRRVTDGSLAGSLTVRVKYAFVQFDNITPRSWIRFGLHQTPWLDFEEGINRYRVEGTMFSEREGLIPGSADFGAGYLTPLPGNYGEVQVGIYNGEGFSQTDANKYKSVQGRLTFRPLPGRGAWNGLRVSGFFNAGWYAANQPRHLGIVMGSFEHPHVVATAQYLAAVEKPVATAVANTDRTGASVFLEVRKGLAGWAGLVRVDAFDPNDDAVDDSKRRIIAGGAYWFVWPRARVGLVLTNEQVHYDDGAHLPTENRLLFQTHIEF